MYIYIYIFFFTPLWSVQSSWASGGLLPRSWSLQLLLQSRATKGLTRARPQKRQSTRPVRRELTQPWLCVRRPADFQAKAGSSCTSQALTLSEEAFSHVPSHISLKASSMDWISLSFPDRGATPLFRTAPCPCKAFVTTVRIFSTEWWTHKVRRIFLASKHLRHLATRMLGSRVFTDSAFWRWMDNSSFSSAVIWFDSMRECTNAAHAWTCGSPRLSHSRFFPSFRNSVALVLWACVAADIAPTTVVSFGINRVVRIALCSSRMSEQFLRTDLAKRTVSFLWFSAWISWAGGSTRCLRNGGPSPSPTPSSHDGADMAVDSLLILPSKKGCRSVVSSNML